MKRLLWIACCLGFIQIHAQDSIMSSKYIKLPSNIIKTLHDTTPTIVITDEKHITHKLHRIMDSVFQKWYSFKAKPHSAHCDDCTYNTIYFILQKGNYIFAVYNNGPGYTSDYTGHLTIFNYGDSGAKILYYDYPYYKTEGKITIVKPEDLIKASDINNFYIGK
jgi:hypothetical protein